jgi:hypothetical protein
VTVNLRFMSADIYTASNGRFFYSRKAAKYTNNGPLLCEPLSLVKHVH